MYTSNLDQNKTLVKRRISLLRFWRDIPALSWLLVLVVGLTSFSQFGAFLAWVLIVMWILRGPDEALEGLILSLVLIFFNPGLNTSNNLATLARWIVFLEATISVAISWWRQPSRPKQPQWQKFLILFFIYGVTTSILVSSWSAVSLLKIVNFSLIALISYYAVRLGTRDWQLNLIALGTTVSILSLPLIFHPTGYLKNGYQFQGILSHPQSYGVIISVTLAAAIGRWFLDGRSRISLPNLLFLASMVVTVVLSSARTGYFALLIALFASLILTQSKIKILVKWAYNPLLYFLLAGLIILFANLDTASYFNVFFFERDVSAYRYGIIAVNDKSSPIVYLIASRMDLFIQSWANFVKSPIFGIGFGLPSIPVRPEYIQYVRGIPIAMPYEKGFLGIAILEEVGILGTALLMLMLLNQLILIVRSRLASSMLLFLTAVLINVGESVYFAAGGIGLLVHLSIATALVSAERKSILDRSPDP